jgi:hypothetical protein
VQLERYLGVLREVINIAEIWDKSPPPEGEGKTIKEFLNKVRGTAAARCHVHDAEKRQTGFYPFYYDGYNVNKQLLEDHLKKFGKEVYSGSYMRWKMQVYPPHPFRRENAPDVNRETGSKITLEQKEQGLREGAIYRRWFAKHVLRKDKDTASDAILVMPLSCYAPDYRDNIHK